MLHPEMVRLQGSCPMQPLSLHTQVLCGRHSTKYNGMIRQGLSQHGLLSSSDNMALYEIPASLRLKFSALSSSCGNQSLPEMSEFRYAA